MGTIATFTLRDLNRQPAKVFAAVRKFGMAEVRTRSGEVFTVAPKAEDVGAHRKKALPDFKARWKRMQALGHSTENISAEENERINRVIAGEE